MPQKFPLYSKQIENDSREKQNNKWTHTYSTVEVKLWWDVPVFLAYNRTILEIFDELK